jgi:hypothetical protein
MAKGFISDCEGGDPGERTIFSVGGIDLKLLHRSMLSEPATEDLEVLGLFFKGSGCTVDHQESTAFLHVSIQGIQGGWGYPFVMEIEDHALEGIKWQLQDLFQR